MFIYINVHMKISQTLDIYIEVKKEEDAFTYKTTCAFYINYPRIMNFIVFLLMQYIF